MLGLSKENDEWVLTLILLIQSSWEWAQVQDEVDRGFGGWLWDAGDVIVHRENKLIQKCLQTLHLYKSNIQIISSSGIESGNRF